MKAIVLQGQWAPKPELRLSPEHQAQKKAPGSLAWKDPRYRAQTIDDPSPGHGEVVVRRLHLTKDCNPSCYCLCNSFTNREMITAYNTNTYCDLICILSCSCINYCNSSINLLIIIFEEST